LVEERSDLQVCYLLSRAVSAQAVVVFINLTLSHQVEITQAFSLNKSQNFLFALSFTYHFANFEPEVAEDFALC
jgi:hypothetical protein